MKPKLVYIIPQLSQSTYGHYYHLYELLEVASSHFDITLLVEHGNFKPNTSNVSQIKVQRFEQFPLSVLERLWIVSKLRLMGWKSFYIHQSQVSSISISLLCKLFGGKTYFWYCTCEDIYEKENRRKNYLFRLNLKLINYLVTANEGMKEYYHQVYKVPLSKIFVMSGAIDTKRYEQRNKQNEEKIIKQLNLQNRNVVLFVHSLSPRKGSRYLPSIIGETVKRDSTFSFLIIGDGPDRQWLESEIVKNKLIKYVHMLGSVPNTQITDYFHISTVFIMPSQIEEQGRVQFEAMAAGLPMVVFESIGPQYILSPLQKQYMVAQGDTVRFAKNVLKAISHSKQLREEGYKMVPNYSFTMAVSKLEQLLEL